MLSQKVSVANEGGRGPKVYASQSDVQTLGY